MRIKVFILFLRKIRCSINCVTVDSDSHMCYVGCGDGQAFGFSLNNLTDPAVHFQSHSGYVSTIAYVNNLLVTGSFDSTLRFWDRCSGAARGEPLQIHEEPVHKVMIEQIRMPGQQHESAEVLSSSSDGTIRQFSLQSPRLPRVVCRLDGGVFAFILSSCKTVIYAGMSDGTVYEIDFATGSELREFGNQKGVITSLVLCPLATRFCYERSEKVLLSTSGSTNGSALAVWDLGTHYVSFCSCFVHERSHNQFHRNIIVSGFQPVSVSISLHFEILATI